MSTDALRLVYIGPPLVAIVMKSPVRGDDQVTGLHLCAFAVDRFVGTTAFHCKAQRALGVPMAGCYLARHADMQDGKERLHDI